MSSGPRAVPFKAKLAAAFLAPVGAWILMTGISSRTQLHQPAQVLSAKLTEVHTRGVGRSWHTQICVSLEGYRDRFCRDVRDGKAQEEARKAGDLKQEVVGLVVRAYPESKRRSMSHEVQAFELTSRGREVWNQAEIERQFYLRDYLMWTVLGSVFACLSLLVVAKVIREAMRK